MYQVEALCTRAIWLEKGNVMQLGHPATVVASYLTFLDREMAQTSAHEGAVAPAAQGHARIAQVQTMVDDAIGTSLEVQSGQQTLRVRVSFASDPKLPTPVVALTLNGPDGRILVSSSTQSDGLILMRDAAGWGYATIEFPMIPLLKGEYSISVYLLSEDGIHIYDGAVTVATLHFSQKTLEQGVVSLPHAWHCGSGPEVAALPRPD